MPLCAPPLVMVTSKRPARPLPTRRRRPPRTRRAGTAFILPTPRGGISPTPCSTAGSNGAFMRYTRFCTKSGTGLPLVQEDRIQNHSSMLGIFVCRYACTADIADLEQAHRPAELVLRFQREDGGFYKGDTDYTSVIYPAKSIMELVRAQLARRRRPHSARRPGAVARAGRAAYGGAAPRHGAPCRADGNFSNGGGYRVLLRRRANSCSAAQLSEFALMLAEDSPDRERYTEAARRILESTPPTSRRLSRIAGWRAARCAFGRRNTMWRWAARLRRPVPK